MANIEKLIKAFEALKVLQPESNTTSDESTTSTTFKIKKEVIISKKDKIAQCNVVADCITSINLRNSPDFPKFLGVAVETFLMLCEDAESDVRIVTDECLNRTIKTLMESNLGRLQVELYKEIKKNGPARSLRAALWRFADLCHLIRPQKCRPYVVNLLPCLSRICKRNEETVQETLSSAMQKICPVLVGFTTDIEIKMLLKSFLPNIRSSSVTMRRTAALCLSLICRHSRKPETFSVWLLNVLLDSIIPLEEMTDVNVILGVLLALRHLLSHLSSSPSSSTSSSSSSASGPHMKGSFGTKFSESDVGLNMHQLIKVLELFLYFSGHDDHNVVSASLEALQQLLKNAPGHLLDVLLTPGGISRVNVGETPEPLSERSESKVKLTSVGDDVCADADVDVSSSESEEAIIILSQSVGGNDETIDEAAAETEGAITRDDDADSTAAESVASSAATNDASNYSGVSISGLREGGGILSQSSSNDTLSSVLRMESPDHIPLSILRGAISNDRLSNEAEKLKEEEDEGEKGAGGGGADANGSLVAVREGDVGFLSDDNEVPLVYLVRLLCKEFLLTGYEYGLLSDRRVRVSIKALALNCISHILELFPKAFLLKLHRFSSEPGELQDIKDILRYISHSDPQLKGNTTIIIGQLLRAGLTEGRGSFDKWVKSSGVSKDYCTLNDLVAPLVSILEDDNSVAVRCALTALQLCLPCLLNSHHSDVGLSIILSLLQLKNNSYWLVKVELVELLALIDYKTVFYLESVCSPTRTDGQPYLRKLEIQDHVLNNVMLVLLGDEDLRVRHATSIALCRMVPKLFYGVDSPLQDPITAKAKEYTMDLLNTVMEDWSLKALTSASHSSTTIKPFDQIINKDSLANTSFTGSSLSRVVMMIVRHLTQSVNRLITLGCCHSLCLLSEQFSVAEFANAWGCYSINQSSSSSETPSSSGNKKNKSVAIVLNVPFGCIDDSSMTMSGVGSLPLFLSLLTSSPLALDLSIQADALKFVGNLFSGAACRCLRCSDNASDDVHWSSLGDRWLTPIADQILTHVARLLNICLHVIEDQIPGPPPSKSSLPSLPNAPSLSPIKRKAKATIKDETASAAAVQQNTLEKGQIKPTGKDVGKETEKEKEKNKKEGLGVFYNQQQYMKLYEVLKGAYSNYKISLDWVSSEKFLHLLRVTLGVLSQLLEVSSLVDIGKYTDELLTYLRSTIAVEASASVLCVQQLLKAIFGTNISGQYESNDEMKNRQMKTNRPNASINVKQGIYHSCLNSPYTQFTQNLASATFRANVHATDQEEATSFISWLKRKAEKKAPSLLKFAGKSEKMSVASYIRLFEPLVIKALKQYTITSHVTLQKQVLDLLSHLVQLRVNYCLLDSDQIFIGYVIKQIEYIEEGQIRNSELLIPNIFNFLILLSYERYHSKTIIMMPKIIQLCDGLMASGQDPTTHAIPSLQCIVNDLFIVRGMNKTDSGKDLETQREVVISMLLRLLQHYQMLELFIIVLHQCRKESEERWKRLSRQVTDLILPLLANQQVNLYGPLALDVVHRLFENVSPSVFRPVDILLKVLLVKPHDLSTMQGLQRWVGLVLVTLRVVMAQSKEEVVLSRLEELELTMSVYKHTVQHHRDNASAVGIAINMDSHRDNASAVGMTTTKGYSLPNDGSIEQGEKLDSGEETIARFLLQVVGVVVSELKQHTVTMVTSKKSCDFLCQELAHLLLYITHMFQSGIYRRVAMVAMAMIRKDQPSCFYNIQEINAAFKCISYERPTLMLQWCNILILLNYDDQAWWSRVLCTPNTYMGSNSTPIHPPTLQNIQRDELTEPQQQQHNDDDDDDDDCSQNSTGGYKCIDREIVRKGGLILLCDYVCENLTDAEHMTWVIINHVYDLICLSLEPPVQDFVNAIHRNSAASGLFIQAIHSKCEHINTLNPSVVKRMLNCLEAIHLSQSGTLLSLLVEKFLKTHHLSIARICDVIACRRVEMLLAENHQEIMTSNEVEKLIEFMKINGLVKRHSRLATLFGKLESVLNPEKSHVLFSHENHVLTSVDMKNQKDFDFNKELFLEIVKEHCFGEKVFPKVCAKFLQHLDYTSILSVIMAEECNVSILEECIVLGTDRTILAVSRSSSQSPSKQEPTLDPLLQSSQITLFRRLNHVINMLPMPHEVMNFDLKVTEDQYRDKMEEFFTDSNWFHVVFYLSKALLKYLRSLPLLPCNKQIPEDSLKDIGRFGTLFLEALHWLLLKGRYPSSDQLLTAIECYSSILFNDQLAIMMELREQTTIVCATIHMVHSLLCSFLVLPGDNLVKLPDQDNKEEIPNCGFDDLHHAIRACDQISELVHSLTTHLKPDNTRKTPQYLMQPLRCLIIALARMPLVNSYARTPPLVWKLGTWMPSPSGDIKTKLPPLPLNFLQEKDILSDFIVRVNLLGWTCRQQFEETWMSLLGVLNPVSYGPHQNPLSPEEIVDRTQCQILATRGITSLLVLSTLTPHSGSPGNSNYDFRPRNKQFAFLNTWIGKKLAFVKSILDEELLILMRDSDKDHLNYSKQERKQSFLLGNLERELNDKNYRPGQFCVESLWSLVGMLDVNNHLTSESGSDTETNTSVDSPNMIFSPHSTPSSSLHPLFSPTAARTSRLSGLDIHSCLQFLLELYGTMMSSTANPRTPLVLLNETIRSIVILSDVFTDRGQFEWMLTLFLDIQKSHPPEDELISHYLVFGICKSAAVVGTDVNTNERIIKMVDSSLRSTHLPTKLSALYGSLYLLEAGMSELVHQLIPILTEYILKSLGSITSTTIHSQQHVLLMWSLAFYIRENYWEEIMDTDFASKMFQLCISLVSITHEPTPLAIYLTVLNGLERLLLTKTLSQKDSDALIKLSIDRFCQPSPLKSLAALSLLLTSMYTGLDGKIVTDDAEEGDGTFDAELLIMAMERVTVLFDRIRKGLPSEARVITRILPSFLMDFFPAQDIMNKVIGEFLYSQQPHPQLMANVVFQVFDSLIQSNEHSLVKNWVMLSLSNFTQRTPLSMAIWSLTCFFISASTNQWLKALFPYVVGRMGKLEKTDERLFCVAALDFNSHLRDDSHIRTFQATFQTVAQTGSLYMELLSYLPTNSLSSTST